MNIAILGTGNVGSGLGKLLLVKGHHITFGSRDPASHKREKLPPDAALTTIQQAVDLADVVFIATPWAGDVTMNILKNIHRIEGKIFVDCTNPLSPDYMSNLLGHTTSSAEQIAEQVKPALVVKAFNTIFADVMDAKKQIFDGIAATGFYCGDDIQAKAIIKQLIQDCGFDPVDSGVLKNARYLEPMAQLNIQIAYGMQGGTDVAFKYMTRK